MEHERNTDRQSCAMTHNSAIQLRNELVQQEKFLKAAKRFLEQELLCLQLDEVKLKERMRSAQMKNGNKENDKNIKVDPPTVSQCSVNTSDNSSEGYSGLLMTQSNSASYVHRYALRPTPGRIASLSGFEDSPSVHGDLQIMKSEDED